MFFIMSRVVMMCMTVVLMKVSVCMIIWHGLSLEHITVGILYLFRSFTIFVMMFMIVVVSMVVLMIVVVFMMMMSLMIKLFVTVFVLIIVMMMVMVMMQVGVMMCMFIMGMSRRLFIEVISMKIYRFMNMTASMNMSVVMVRLQDIMLVRAEGMWQQV